MKLYHVQLETPTHNYSYEVYTNGFDAGALARVHLAGLIGNDQAAMAHLGGYSDIGFDPDRIEPLVTLTNETPDSE